MSSSTSSINSGSSSATASATSSGDEITNSCFGVSCSNQWEWARWVIFVLFMVVLSVFVLTTFRINYLRRRRGQQPLRYVSWLTPPTYRQAESSRNRTDVPLTDYVPPYTEEANENDLGYYDRDGVFHVNSKADPPPPIDAYVLERRNDRDGNVDLEMQQTARTDPDTITPNTPLPAPPPPAFQPYAMGHPGTPGSSSSDVTFKSANPVPPTNNTNTNGH